LRIIERPYYYEEPGESSSRQMTHIVSNYNDERIYEVKKRQQPLEILSSNSPKTMQMITPKVVIGGVTEQFFKKKAE